MAHTKNFLMLCGVLLCVIVGFFIFGWWILVPAVGGLLWELARPRMQAQPKPTQPHPACVSQIPSKPASTVTWQETVAAIERARGAHTDTQ